MPLLMSPERFDELAVQYDTQLVDTAHKHGSLLYIHLHGALDGVLEHF